MREVINVVVTVEEGTDLEELYEAGCPVVKLLPAKYVVDRDAVVRVLAEGRTDALPKGLKVTITGGYVAKAVNHEAV